MTGHANVRPPRVVCIMGAMPDTGNRGVSALCNSVVKNVLAAWPDARIAMFGGNRSANTQSIELTTRHVPIEILNYRLSPRSRLREHLGAMLLLAWLHHVIPIRSLKRRLIRSHRVLSALADASMIGDIRGGDSFSDIYGLRTFLVGCLPYSVVLWLDKDLVFLPQTFGPFRSRLARGVARYFLRQASKIYCRDRQSVEVVETLRGPGPAPNAIALCPDVAFTLDAIKPDTIETVPSTDFRAARPLLGLNVSGLLYEDAAKSRDLFGLRFNYRDFIKDLIRQLHHTTPAHILLIPHTFGAHGGAGGDLNACRAVVQTQIGADPHRLSRLDREYDPSRLKWIIGQCDFFVGSRMHACIAAVSQGVPTAPVAYSSKFSGVFDAVGLSDLVIDPRSLNQQAAIDAVLRAFSSRDVLKAEIQRLTRAASSGVTDTFTAILPPSPLAPACHAPRRKEPESS